MELKINRIEMTNFKGVQHKVIELNGKSARLCAQNGGFKTTTADAWYFVMANCNTAMVNNPDVVPIGADEVKPTVEIEMTIDNKIVTVKKVQTFKKKENTSSVSNTYYINDVEKSYKDFVADLTERGIDMENLLMFSHPNAFMADTSKQGREKMRNILFKMCENTTDEQIASEMSDINELKALLENYRLDEVEQMNRATLKKINDEFGKDNSIIRARIEELIGQKSTVDEKVLTEQKKNYEAEINRIDKKLMDLTGNRKENAEKLTKLYEEKEQFIRKANQKLNEERSEIEKQIHELTRNIDEQGFQLEQAKSGISKTESLLADKKADIEKKRVLYKVEQDAVIDEGDLVCPVCNRTYDKEKLAEIKKNFEINKQLKLETIKASGETLNSQIKEDEIALKEFENKVKLLTDTIDKLQKQREDVQQKLDSLPEGVQLSANDDYNKICEDIAELETETSKDTDSIIDELNSQKNVNNQMLNQVLTDLGCVARNEEIDKRIAELRQAQKDTEIRRADAEKLLFQVDLFKKYKNEKLTTSINSHFNIINFKLFDFQKNGNYVETVEILIDDKPLNSCANGSLIQLAKLDCLAGLQDYFNQHICTFLEDAALITSNTSERLKLNSQLIQLVAVEGIKELEVKDV